ncbi:hypothetical protein VWZ82_12890 [Phaeobacter sp. JH20_41]|uniref:hypothetical protein n=1 Tax=Phaeobacter sp. JH20_41 TaxID=3112498 RepID=UPI003A86CA4A
MSLDPFSGVKDMLYSGLDHLADLDLRFDFDPCGRYLCVAMFLLVRIPGHFDKSESAGCRGIVIEHIKRVQAGVEAVSANLNLSVFLESLADLVLEFSAGPVPVETFVGDNAVLHVGSPVA